LGFSVLLVCYDLTNVVYRPVDAGSMNGKTLTESESFQEAFQGDCEPDSTNNDGSVKHDKMKQKLRDMKEEITTNVASVITVHNVKEAVCFMSVFIAACVTGFFHVIRYVGDYSLKVMREFSVFIQASTPIFIAIVDFFGKCVGGFYLLIAMFWRGSNVNPPQNLRPQQEALPWPHNKESGFRR
jgi:hypothetical protein